MLGRTDWLPNFMSTTSFQNYDRIDKIARDLDDDRDELARSQEEGWPYTDEDQESTEYGRSQEKG